MEVCIIPKFTILYSYKELWERLTAMEKPSVIYVSIVIPPLLTAIMLTVFWDTFLVR